MHTSIANYRPSNHERDKVRELVPQYLRDSAANLISFMEEYYSYLNREGYASYELDHIIDEGDIDVTSEKYLDAIQSEIAKIVPNSNVVDRNTLYKRIVHYYRIKGTPESVSVFFQIMFDSLVDVYYPGDNLFKLSAGTFNGEGVSGVYTKDSGFLSNADKIQDSNFWQDYSYRIRTNVEASKWESAFQRLVHPAGMKFFVLVDIFANSNSRWDKFEKYEQTPDDTEGWFASLRPPRLRGFDSYEGSHTPRYQPGWFSTYINEQIISVAENYFPLFGRPNANNLNRSIGIKAKMQYVSTNWSNQINAAHYYERGFWDDPTQLSKLNIFQQPLSSLINEYQQEYVANRLDAEEAPQPSVELKYPKGSEVCTLVGGVENCVQE